MLQGGDVQNYAQIGFLQIAGQNKEHTFTEWSLSEQEWARTLHPGFQPGDVKHYEVIYSFVDGRVRMYRGGALLDTTPAVDGEWQGGWSGRFLGETWDYYDDIPGAPKSHTDYAQARLKEGRDCDDSMPRNPSVFQNSPEVYKFAWTKQPGAL